MKQNKLKILVPVVSILLAFGIGMVLMACLGADPIQALGDLFFGAFGTGTNFSTTLVKATPLIFCGLCACFAYRCGMLNLGGEGQFIMGSIVSVWIATRSGLTGLPCILLCLLAGTLAGGLWAAIPAALKITRNVNEMIVSIMMNYIATLFMGLVYTTLLREGSMPQTSPVPDASKIPALVPGYRVTWGIILAIVAIAGVYYYLFHSSSGFRLRAVGLNPVASRFAGFQVNRYIVASFLVSGGLAGFGGAVELLATQYRLMSGFALGYGFDGVAMTLIAQLNPIATAFVAYFFAVMRTGAATMQAGSGVPTSIAEMIQALIIVFAVASFALVNLPAFQSWQKRIRARRKEK